MNVNGTPHRLPPAVLIPVGPPASGKSTLAAKLVDAGLDPNAVLSSDRLRGQLCGPGPCECPNMVPGCIGGESCQCLNPRVFATIDRQADTLARQGQPFFVDGTNLVAKGRRRHIARAHANGMAAVALLARKRPMDDLLAANAGRDRQVPVDVMERMAAQWLTISAESLLAEGFDHVVEWDFDTSFELLPSGPLATEVTGPFFFIADIHGCWETLKDLLAAAGFDENLNRADGALVVLLGDAVDKGGAELSDTSEPASVGSVQVLRWALRMWRCGRLLWVKGNHERKLARLLATNEDARSGAAVQSTIDALRAQPDADALIADLVRFLPRLPTHLVLDDDGHSFIAVHAGIREDLVGRTDRKAENFCLYVRSGWVEKWQRPETVVYGHVIHEGQPRRHRAEADPTSNVTPGETIGVDTGSFAGGGLTGMDSDGTFHWVPSNPSDSGSFARRYRQGLVTDDVSDETCAEIVQALA